MKFIIPIYFILLIGSSLYGQTYERYKTLSDTLFYSTSLGYDKKISVTVPIEYQGDVPEKSFPLIIVFDSQNQRSYNYILNTIDYLTSTEQMPAAVILGVASTNEKRYKETQLEISDKDAFGSKNELFIFEELIPYARQRLKANDFNLVVGHSRYGYFTTHLLTQRYQEVNAVISLSPFMHQENVNLTDSIVNLYSTYALDKTLYYRFGIGNDYPEDFQELDSKLDLKHGTNERVDFKGTLFIEADHNVTPGLTIGTALYEIFEFWSKQQNAYIHNDNKDLNSVHDLADGIRNHYGSPLKFSLGTLNGKGWYFFNETQYELAIEAWKIMLQAYPNFSEGYLYIIEAQKELKQDFTETLKHLKESARTTTFYTPEEIIELQNEIDKLEEK